MPFALLLAAALTACAPLRSRMTMDIQQVASPNVDQRRPNLVVLHHTSDDSLEEALATLTSPARQVSAHYLIGRDGRIVQLVDERQRAWHAGRSWWGGNTDVNSSSIGIELDNNGNEPFAEEQIVALLALLSDIQSRYRLPVANFVGHADVAPTRKEDPSAFFPWRRLAEHGFGVWCDTPIAPTDPVDPPEPAPANFDLSLALTALGYDPAAPDESLQAFRRHFERRGQALSSAEEYALARCLLDKRTLAPPASALPF